MFNIWSHRYIYKYKDAEIGKLLYEEYAAKIICSEQDFVERLKFLEGEKVKSKTPLQATGDQTCSAAERNELKFVGI